jgi:CheY-like chemotaxis protein
MGSQVRLLIVEDNDADAFLITETLAPGRLDCDPVVVKDGVEACDYLHAREPYRDALPPDLILLDLNLPRLDGHGVLKEIRQDDRLKNIPVVILSSSDGEADVKQGYRLGANCYVTKPVGLREFQSTIKEIENFWFSVALLP